MLNSAGKNQCRKDSANLYVRLSFYCVCALFSIVSVCGSSCSV